MKAALRALFICLTITAFAMADLLTNGSFENTSNTFTANAPGGGMTLPNGSTAIPGWTVTSGETAWLSNSNTFGITTPFGSYLLDLTGYHDAVPYGGVQQSVSLSPGNYTLTFSLGSYQAVPIYSGPVGVTVSAGTTSQSFTMTPPAGSTANVWLQETFDFAVPSSGSVLIRFQGLSAAGGQYIGLDNADLEAAASSTPEPATWTMIICGLAAVGIAKRRSIVGRR